MKSLPLVLACAGLLGAPDSARALPVDAVFDVLLHNGFDPNDATKVGVLTFRLDADLGPRGCRYLGLWSGPSDGALVARCALDEPKTLGNASCVNNAQVAFNSMVTRAPRAPCSVLDRFGQHRDVFLLVGAESADPEGILGLIQWTAALPLVSVFEARPSP